MGESNAATSGLPDSVGTGIGESSAATSGLPDSVGTGMGESNAATSGLPDSVGTGMGESNAATSGLPDSVGTGMGESNATEAGRRPRLGDPPTARIGAPVRVWPGKLDFSAMEGDANTRDGAAEPSIEKVANESTITETVPLINH